MVAAVRISATPELEAAVPTIDARLRLLQDRLNALPPSEVKAVVEAATRALGPADQRAPDAVVALSNGFRPDPAERIADEMDVLRRSFARRQELLANSLTTSQVAELLGTSRQTPHDRVASGSLLAVTDRGALRFPRWQFRADGENGVIPGLPAVIRALDVSPLAKMSWLTRNNPVLGGETPLACLEAGQVDRVVGLARAVGVA